MHSFWIRFLCDQFCALRIGMGAPLACKRNLSRDHKVAWRKFLFRKLLEAIPTALTQNLKDWGWRPIWHTKGVYSVILKSRAKKKNSAEFFWKRFPRRSFRALGIRIGALWQTKEVYLEIIKPSAKHFRAEFFWKRFPQRSSRALRIGLGALWRTKGVSLETLKSRAKIFRVESFWKRFPTALIQSLKDWDLCPFGIRKEFM